MNFLRYCDTILVFLPFALTAVSALLHTHNASFSPDYMLRATAQNITIDCQSRYSVVFNGTSPGPPLYFEEGQTTWVRVYNDMSDQNLTTVRSHPL